ncbi:MAG: universal stress protein [Haloferacaceae archaeon]
MYDRILLPTDGSDVAEAASETAVAFARRFDADLRAIHVREPAELPTGVAAGEGAADRYDGGERATERVAELAADAGVDVTTAVRDREDSVHGTILAYADRHDADCIVMGTHGRTGLDRLALGSVAERTLRESPVPVVTVHGDTAVDPDLDAVLVPTDDSDPARAAADHAVDLATATGATLHTVHVVDVTAFGAGADAPQVLDALREAGRRAIDEVVDRAEAADVSAVEASVLSGAPHDAILDYADEYDTDCIVLGTHGRTGVSRYLLGSVAERVVRLADVPVIVIPSPETAD